MDYLLGPQKPAQLFLHNQTGILDVALIIAVRMILAEYVFIASLEYHASFPTRMFFTHSFAGKTLNPCLYRWQFEVPTAGTPLYTGLVKEGHNSKLTASVTTHQLVYCCALFIFSDDASFLLFGEVRCNPIFGAPGNREFVKNCSDSGIGTSILRS